MHYHFESIEEGVQGWLVPENPDTPSVIDIVSKDGTITKLNSNLARPDVRNAGFHHTGDVGYFINDYTYPGFSDTKDEMEVRDPDSGLVLYRSFNPERHLADRIFRYETQAMPYNAAEASWANNFALYYNALERHPFDTLRWIIESPSAPSIALSGRINFARYEPFLRYTNYKFIALLRDPYEELAERILFMRYATSPESPPELKNHLTGLEGIDVVSRRINLAVPSTIGEAFAYLSEKHVQELSNPVVTSLTCGLDEHPSGPHVELALNKLSTFDLVGVRSRYHHFRDALSTLLSRDVLPAEQASIESVHALVPLLREVKVLKSMFKLDELLYQYTQEAVDRAMKLAPLSKPSTLAQAATPAVAEGGSR
jgi:hypothetical protein